MHIPHGERHRTERIGWLRAAVLGANDGIVSTASLVVGVAAAHATSRDVLVAGVAGLVAGAMSMAAGEYVSVSSQADTEQADLEREREELATDDEDEHEELTAIYVDRGLDPRSRNRSPTNSWPTMRWAPMLATNSASPRRSVRGRCRRRSPRRAPSRSAQPCPC